MDATSKSLTVFPRPPAGFEGLEASGLSAFAVCKGRLVPREFSKPYVE